MSKKYNTKDGQRFFNGKEPNEYELEADKMRRHADAEYNTDCIGGKRKIKPQKKWNGEFYRIVEGEYILGSPNCMTNNEHSFVIQFSDLANCKEALDKMRILNFFVGRSDSVSAYASFISAFCTDQIHRDKIDKALAANPKVRLYFWDLGLKHDVQMLFQQLRPKKHVNYQKLVPGVMVHVYNKINDHNRRETTHESYRCRVVKVVKTDSTYSKSKLVVTVEGVEGVTPYFKYRKEWYQGREKGQRDIDAALITKIIELPEEQQITKTNEEWIAERKKNLKKV